MHGLKVRRGGLRKVGWNSGSSRSAWPGETCMIGEESAGPDQTVLSKLQNPRRCDLPRERVPREVDSESPWRGDRSCESLGSFRRWRSLAVNVEMRSSSRRCWGAMYRTGMGCPRVPGIAKSRGHDGRRWSRVFEACDRKNRSFQTFCAALDGHGDGSTAALATARHARNRCREPMLRAFLETAKRRSSAPISPALQCIIAPRMREPNDEDPRRQGNLIVMKRYYAATGRRACSCSSYGERIDDSGNVRSGRAGSPVCDSFWSRAPGYRGSHLLSFVGHECRCDRPAPWYRDYQFSTAPIEHFTL